MFGAPRYFRRRQDSDLLLPGGYKASTCADVGKKQRWVRHSFPANLFKNDGMYRAARSLVELVRRQTKKASFICLAVFCRQTRQIR
jgi:hypothetical protein